MREGETHKVEQGGGSKDEGTKSTNGEGIGTVVDDPKETKVTSPDGNGSPEIKSQVSAIKRLIDQDSKNAFSADSDHESSKQSKKGEEIFGHDIEEG